jgi:hypothetical protein
MYLEGGHVAGNANGVHDLHLLALHNATVVGGVVVVVSTTTAVGHSWLQMVMKVKEAY